MEWSFLRNFETELVTRDDVDAGAELDAASVPDVLVQLKPLRYLASISAFSNIPQEVLDGETNLERFLADYAALSRGFPLMYPYALEAELSVRVHVRKSEGSPLDVASMTFGSVSLLHPATPEDHPRALRRALEHVDGLVRSHIGAHMLDVNVARNRRDGRSGFDLTVSNPFPMSVRGCVQFPEEDDYTVEESIRGFQLSPGETRVMTFLLEPVDYSVSRARADWWHKTYLGRYERYAPFPFLRLEFDFPHDGLTDAELCLGVGAPEPERIPLLPLIDPARDVLAGQWRIDDEVRWIRGDRARLEIPRHTGLEYDLHISFTQEDPDTPLTLVVPHDDQPVACLFGGSRGVFEIQADRRVVKGHSYPRLRIYDDFPPGAHEAIVKVRSNRVELWLDRKRYLNFETDFRNLDLSSWAQPRDPEVFLIVCGSPTTIQGVDLVEY